MRLGYHTLFVSLLLCINNTSICCADDLTPNPSPPVPQVAPKAKRSASDAAVLAIPDDLNSDDIDRQQLGLKNIETVVLKNPRAIRQNLRRKWLTPLLKLKQYEMVEKLAFQAIIDQPTDSNACADMQYCRLRAIIGSGDDESSVVEAKIYYNICSLKQTEEAIAIVCEVLANTRGKTDGTIVRRFKNQQTQPTQVASIPPDTTAPSSQPIELGENVLKSIGVKSSLFDEAIRSLNEARITYANLTAKGNLLLMADRSIEARKSFESALDLATAKQMPAAVENVARAIRAEDGTLAGANAYIVSLRN